MYVNEERGVLFHFQRKSEYTEYYIKKGYRYNTDMSNKSIIYDNWLNILIFIINVLNQN